MANQLIGNSAVAIHMYQALYGQAPSNALYDSYVSNIAATSPAAFAAGLAGNFTNTSDAALALKVLNNLGVTATTVTAINANGSSEYSILLAAVQQAFAAYPTMRGQVILNMTNLFGNLEADATYGAAATTYNAQASADLAYAANTANTAPGVAPLPNPNAGQIFTLTTAIDTAANFTGGAGNDTFNAATVGTAQTFTSLDAINGGAGTNTLNITSAAALDLAAAVGATVSNIQTANLVSTTTVTGDVSAWAGLTQLNVAEVGGNAGGSVKAATTTAVTLTDAGVATNAITVTGGAAVNVTASGITTAGAINIGSSTTAGAITAVLTDANTTGANAASGIITVAGGTTVNVTQNIAAATSATGLAGAGAGTAYTATGGAININGGAATTSVTATQTAAVAAVGGVTGVTGVAAVVAGTETAAVTFSTLGLAAGKSLTIGGLTVTTAAGLTQAQLETIFASRAAAFAGSAVGDATYSGALTGFGTGAAASDVITFTSSTANTNVTDLAYTDSSALTSVVTTQGKATVNLVTAATAVPAVGGITDGAVVITDANAASLTAANTITSVTLSGYGASTVINDNALATLSLANSAQDVTVNDAGTTKNAALTLTVNKLASGATLNDATIKTLNITASGSASTMAVNAAAATTVTVAGDQKLTLTGSAALVTSFTSTNTGGVTVSLNAGSTGAFGDGADKVTVGAAATKAVTLGAGDDTATVSTLGTGGSVDGGTGTNTLTMAASDAATASLSNTFAGKVSNFQKLVLTGGGNVAVDVATLGGYHNISAVGGATLTLNNTVSGDTLTLTGTGTAYAVAQTNALAGTNDVLNLNTTAGTSTNFGTVTAANVETINITTADSSTTPAGTVVDTLAIDATSNFQKTIVVAGTAALALTAASTAITSFDASGLIVAGGGKAGMGVNWSTAALAAASTIHGSANGGDVINASLATKAVTIIETAGTNTITGSQVATISNTLTGGTGADTIVGGSAADTIVGGGGADKITGGAGADTITVSGTTATIIQAAAGNSGANTSTTIQTSELTSTFDVVKGLAAGDKIDLSAFVIGSGIASSINTSDLTLAGANLATADNKVVFTAGTYDAGAGTFTFAANGADTAMTYDTNVAVAATPLTGETVILVGYHAGATTAAALGVITLG